MIIFSYDLSKKQIEDNSNRDIGIIKHYKIGELFLDFINADFSGYDVKRKQVLSFYKKFKNCDDWEDSLLTEFPDIEPYIGSLCEYTHGMCLEILGYYLLLKLQNPYCSMFQLFSCIEQFSDNNIFDFLQIQINILQKYLPCLDVDMLGSESGVKKYMEIANLSYRMEGKIFQEVTVLRHKYTLQEDVCYEIEHNSNAEEFIPLSLSSVQVIQSAPKNNFKKEDISRNPDCSKREFEIIHGYNFKSPKEALECEFLKMLELNIKIRSCQICKKYFIITKHMGKCCDNLYKDTGLSCQQIYANKNYAKKRKEHPILKEYNRAYKRMYARRSNHKISNSQFSDWLSLAEKQRDKYFKLYDNTPSQNLIDEFKSFLGNN